MKYHFISIGNSLTSFEKSWLDVYLTRLKAFFEIQHTHVKDKIEKSNDRDDAKYVAWIQKLISKEPFLITLDEKGENFTTKDLFSFLENQEITHKQITFLIGGSYGLPRKIVAQANANLSLSQMTFPHKMALLMIVEQIYRCVTLKKKIPYHHE